MTDPSSHTDPGTSTAWLSLIDGIRGYIASRVPADQVDDVLQNALLRVAESIDDIAQNARLESFVHTIVRRTIADFFRGRAKQPTDGADRLEPASDDRPGREPDPDLAVEPAHENLTPYEGSHDVHEEVLSWLRPAAEELPATYRDPLIMADFRGMKQQEVADRLGLSLSGAKSRIQRARKMLSDAIKECCEVEFGSDGRAVAYRPLDRCENC